jgi:hypothetical protein
VIADDVAEWARRATAAGLDDEAIAEGVDMVLAHTLPTIGWWKRALASRTR